jgi:iron complex outermembrane recepter protein
MARAVAKRSRRVCVLLCAVLLAAAGLPSFAEEVHSFDIDARTPAAAIHAFAAQSGVEILAAGERLAGKRLNPVSGQFATDVALQKLLAGSGLHYRYVGDRSIALVAAVDEKPSRRVRRYWNRQSQEESAAAATSGGGAASATPAVTRSEPPVDSQSNDSTASGFGLETVTVTARKRAENLQDTPISIAAFSGESLERRQIFSTEDLDQITPNLQFATIAPLSGNNSAAQVFIRGIGQTDATAGVDPGVGIYIDDVYMGSAVGGAMDFRDIASVQILRGPQGTLFGRNTIGGALLLTTVDPGDEFGGSVRVGVGTDQLIEGFAAVDLPVSDTLKTRWTAGKRNRDGYVTRPFDGVDLGDVDSYSLSGKALWTPTDDLTFSFKVDYTKADEHGTPLVFAAINETAAFPRAVSFAAGCAGMTSVASPVPMIDDPRCANDFWNDGAYAANGTLPLQSTLENWGVALIGEWAFIEALSFKSITSYRELDWTGNRDADNTPFPILHTLYDSHGDQLSQELQALVKAGKLTGVFGLFYFDQSTDDILRVTLSPPPAPQGTVDSNDNLIDNQNWAAFTQWTYQLTDALSFTGGVRYTSETKASTPFQFNFSNPSVLYVPNRKFERDFSATTGSASVQYRWNPTVMTYLSWTQGFKSGGFNSRFNGVVPGGAPPAFDPEKADSLELGAKLDISNQLRINAALFSTSYDDLQFTYRIGTAPFLFNAGEASIDGLDLELEYAPTAALLVSTGFGYLDASIDSVSTIVGATTSVTTHSELPYTPEFQGNASAAYIVPMGARLTVTPRLEVVYTASQFFDAGNTVEIAQNDSITLLNFGLTVESDSGGWRLAAGLNNITDELYPIAGNSSLTTSSGYAEIAYNRGREAFLSLTKRF